MEDQEIIKLLFDRDETALRDISSTYGRLYTDVLRRILCDRCDIEECTNDVLLAVWNSIPPNRPEHLAPYLCTLAKRIGIDRLRHNTRAKRNSGYVLLLSELEECIPDNTPLAEEDDGTEIRDVLNNFLRALDHETRVLFIRRYVYSESVSELAARFGIKENTISARLLRARKQLRQILIKEGIGI